ncbi:MAG TPA: hypothetical protein VD838_16535, partial [Anaeromyxobacteraceae bacterium]|nr:hypothetical protein [Anaeromyxobacteraceae bacterium]
DKAGEPSMRRRAVIGGQLREYPLDVEDSSDPAAFAAFVDWAAAELAAERWAVVVVGHGGAVGDLSPDDHSVTVDGTDANGPPPERTWMRLESYVEPVRRLNAASGGAVGLLFLQNCFKGTLESAATAAGAAELVLASQLLLGAPNHYYGGFLDRLRRTPYISAREAVGALVEAERPDMYHTLTLVDGEAAARIPDALNPLLGALLGGEPVGLASLGLRSFSYMGERYADAAELFRALVTVTGRGLAELERFEGFMGSELVVGAWDGGELYSRAARERFSGLSGLSVMLPASVEDVERNARLPLYRSTRLPELFRRMLSA